MRRGARARGAPAERHSLIPPAEKRPFCGVWRECAGDPVAAERVERGSTPLPWRGDVRSGQPRIAYPPYGNDSASGRVGTACDYSFRSRALFHGRMSGLPGSYTAGQARWRRDRLRAAQA